MNGTQSIRVMERDRRSSRKSNLLVADGFTKLADMSGSDQSTEKAETTRTTDTAVIFEGAGMRASLTSGLVVTLLHLSCTGLATLAILLSAGSR